MTRATRILLLRKVRQARRLMDAVRDHQAAADEMFAEAQALVDEIQRIREGRPPMPALDRAGGPSRPVLARQP